MLNKGSSWQAHNSLILLLLLRKPTQYRIWKVIKGKQIPGSESIGEIEANKSKNFTTHKILIEKEGNTSSNWSKC